MRKKSCAFERDVLNGLRTGSLTPAAKEHAETCTVCRESIVIHHWMNRFQTAEPGTKAMRKELPDVESLWEKAYSPSTLIPDKKLEKKALIPLLFAQLLTYAVTVIVMIYLLSSNFLRIKDLLETKLELPTIIAAFSAMFKPFLKSASYMIIPLSLGLTALVIFTIAAALEDKNVRGRKQYIF